MASRMSLEIEIAVDTLQKPGKNTKRSLFSKSSIWNLRLKDILGPSQSLNQRTFKVKMDLNLAAGIIIVKVLSS